MTDQGKPQKMVRSVMRGPSPAGHYLDEHIAFEFEGPPMNASRQGTVPTPTTRYEIIVATEDGETFKHVITAQYMKFEGEWLFLFNERELGYVAVFPSQAVISAVKQDDDPTST